MDHVPEMLFARRQDVAEIQNRRLDVAPAQLLDLPRRFFVDKPQRPDPSFGALLVQTLSLGGDARPEGAVEHCRRLQHTHDAETIAPR